jgi:hypothetical protein
MLRRLSLEIAFVSELLGCGTVAVRVDWDELSFLIGDGGLFLTKFEKQSAPKAPFLTLCSSGLLAANC